MKNFIIFNEKFIIFNTNLFDVENVNDRLSRKEGMLVGGAANIHHFQYKISSFSIQNSSFSIQTCSCKSRQSGPAKFIILNTQFLVFDTKFLAFIAKFIIFTCRSETDGVVGVPRIAK